MKNIIFLAPPSAGKGTQGEMLVKDYGYTLISIGELLRNAIANGSKYAEIIEYNQSNGILVPDDITIEVLREKLDITEKYILDGFPRSIDQAKKLENILKELNRTDYFAIYLDISREESLKRASGRRTCEGCGKVYNIHYAKLTPKIEDVCDDCGNKLGKRNDQNLEVDIKRFDTFAELMIPILEY